MTALLSAACLAGCGATEGAPASGKLQVLAAESFWGSIAAQLGGDKVSVSSIVVDPRADPHAYEPTPEDARTIAGAQLAIVNGIGYDPWADRLLAANPLAGRLVLNVGATLGLRAGANPHQWYAPASVRAVIDRIVADYQTLLPQVAVYFAARRKSFLHRALARYEQLLTQIRARYAGVPVGYSESIFAPLGQALGLRLATPPGFAKAIAEGTEVSAADKQAVDAQAQGRQIEVWVYNSQNVTPDVQQATDLARAQGIPIVTVTETLSPASKSFQQWQVTQLEALMRALRRATGR